MNTKPLSSFKTSLILNLKKGGIKMVEKNIMEFVEQGDDLYIIKINVYQIDREEHKKIRGELEEYNIKYEYIDADSLSGRIEIQGYNEAYKILKKLEADGWGF